MTEEVDVTMAEIGKKLDEIIALLDTIRSNTEAALDE
jgi:hypothetical protein